MKIKRDVLSCEPQTDNPRPKETSHGKNNFLQVACQAIAERTGKGVCLRDERAVRHLSVLLMIDFVGIGRMVLTYPEMCADVLEGKPLQRKRICRTFSDCTTAPRNGMVSGCYPLDEFYKDRPEAKQLKEAKAK